ncbi:MAG: GNAT family N-acetyltransferase [Oligoflexia bacterium]|nr:GNAT family N-acetyltransferase [Oligoflexia bacterium]
MSFIERLRVHIDYRGQKIGRQINEYLIDYTKDLLKQKKINKIALASHLNNKESVSLVKKLNFKLKQENLVLWKEELDLGLDAESTLTLKNFSFKNWSCSFEEFTNLEYIKRRNNLIDLSYVFQRPTYKLYEEIKSTDGFVEINGYRGIFKLKGDPYFITLDESFEAINTFTNYYLLKLKLESELKLETHNKPIFSTSPVTSLTEINPAIIQRLKEEKYTSWSNWQKDYLYFVYEEI